MIEYYGRPGTGKPFGDGLNGRYFAWSPEKNEGWWVTVNGTWTSRSLYTRDMLLPRTWTRVFICEADADLTMDEGL